MAVPCRFHPVPDERPFPLAAPAARRRVLLRPELPRRLEERWEVR